MIVKQSMEELGLTGAVMNIQRRERNHFSIFQKSRNYSALLKVPLKMLNLNLV